MRERKELFLCCCWSHYVFPLLLCLLPVISSTHTIFLFHRCFAKKYEKVQSILLLYTTELYGWCSIKQHIVSRFVSIQYMMMLLCFMLYIYFFLLLSFFLSSFSFLVWVSLLFGGGFGSMSFEVKSCNQRALCRFLENLVYDDAIYLKIEY